MISVSLYRELLKQKLKPKFFKLLRTNQNFYFLMKAIANINKNKISATLFIACHG